MRIFADESVYRITTEILRRAGHDVLTVQEAGFAGSIDPVVLSEATHRGYIFLTNDMHFSKYLGLSACQVQRDHCD